MSAVASGDFHFDNGTAFNDYFDDFTFGSTLSFQVSLYGPALSSPDGVSTSGSTFAFSMFSDAAGTIPALTTDTTDGFAFTVNVNLDGTTTVSDFSSQTSITAPSTPVPTVSSPALIALALLLVGLGGFAARRNTAGASKALALAALLLLPFGCGTRSLSAQALDHQSLNQRLSWRRLNANDTRADIGNRVRPLLQPIHSDLQRNRDDQEHQQQHNRRSVPDCSRFADPRRDANECDRQFWWVALRYGPLRGQPCAGPVGLCSCPVQESIERNDQLHSSDLLRELRLRCAESVIADFRFDPSRADAALDRGKRRQMLHRSPAPLFSHSYCYNIAPNRGNWGGRLRWSRMWSAQKYLAARTKA